MIQLQAVARPIELTDELVEQLTEKYKTDDTAVWR